MKKLLLAICLIPMPAFAAGPTTTCPTGYITINDSAIIVVNGNSCPGGYASLGTAESCLVASPAGVCIMFAPADTIYSDDIGNYKYTEICPLN